MDLSSIDLFSGFDTNAVSFLNTITREKTYHKGNILFYAGEAPKSLLILQKEVWRSINMTQRAMRYL